jgi:hypothetical protein
MGIGFRQVGQGDVGHAVAVAAGAGSRSFRPNSHIA